MSVFKRIQEEQNALKEVYNNRTKVNAREIGDFITPENIFFTRVKQEDEIVITFNGDKYFYAPTSFKALIKAVLDDFMGDVDELIKELRKNRFKFVKINLDGIRTYIETIIE